MFTGRVNKGEIILWDDLYEEIFISVKGRNKFKDKNRLTEAFERLGEYRGNIIHDNHIDKHDNSKKKIVEGFLAQLNSLIDPHL